MNRRWICRLGIRLESKEAPNNTTKSITVIKEICKDTVAERDGRLIPGDRVLMVSNNYYCNIKKGHLSLRILFRIFLFLR